jgi:cytochrome oxidase assembly protein ShyY1
VNNSNLVTQSEEKPVIFALNQRNRTVEEKTSYRKIENDGRFLYDKEVHAHKNNRGRNT